MHRCTTDTLECLKLQIRERYVRKDRIKDKETCHLKQ